MGAIAIAYTTVVHVLFRFNILSRPQIQNIPPPSSCSDTTSKGSDTDNNNKHDKETRPKKKRIAIVTGSNTGIGFFTAKRLVQEYGMDVILACRCEEKARKAAQAINEDNLHHHSVTSGGRAIFVCPCNLGQFSSVRAFAQAVHNHYDGIDTLVNNAGLRTTGRTDDGYDLLFQACFLGHFLLTNLLLDLFPEDGSGRIVNLSSVKHHFQTIHSFSGSVTMDDSYWRNSAMLQYKANECYPNAKLAAILFTLELNRRFYHSPHETASSSSKEDPKTKKQPPRVRAFAANPGAVNSDLWRHVKYPGLVLPLWKALFLTSEQGCATTVAAAVGDDFEDDVYYLQPYWMPSNYGRYKAPLPIPEMLGPFVGFRVTQPRLPTNPQMASLALWRVSEELTHLSASLDGKNNHDDETVLPTIPSSNLSRDGDGIPSARSKTAAASDEGARRARPAMGIITNTAPVKKKTK